VCRIEDAIPTTVSARVAHDVLADLRSSEVLYQDMTHGDFDWRGYLKSRPDFQELVGPGITAFLFMRFPDILDANHSYGARADFVIHRVDLRSIRLHPARSGRQPKAIWGAVGRLDRDWFRSTAQPATEAASVAPYDRLSRKDARQALDRLAADMASRGESSRDLTDGREFMWWRWLAGIDDPNEGELLPASAFHAELVPAKPGHNALGPQRSRFVVTRPYDSYVMVRLAVVPEVGHTVVKIIDFTSIAEQDEARKQGGSAASPASPAAALPEQDEEEEALDWDPSSEDDKAEAAVGPEEQLDHQSDQLEEEAAADKQSWVLSLSTMD
jgi:hypothetical protein